MARSREELISHLRAFRDLWAERITDHPDPVVRRQARLTAAMYADACRAADQGAPLSVICGQLSAERRAIHGCREAIELERQGA